MTRILNTLAESRRMSEKLKFEQSVLVVQARALGETWADIGAALGMSAQGAQQAHGTVREKRALKGQTTIDEA